MQTEEPTIKMALQKTHKIKLPTLPWQWWGVLLILCSSGIGFTATSMLVGLPKGANCHGLFLPLTSASGRLYCAELKAEERTTASLLEAIALVSDLPPDHPLRNQIDNSVEAWAASILQLADEKFQAGKLKEAISIAKKIPTHLQAYQLVAKKIQAWQTSWDEAEATFKLVEDQLRQSNWNQAFREAVKLTYLDNQYWATTKYEEAIDLISQAREESTKLDQAYILVRRGGLDNLLKAATGAQEIPKSSYAYNEAQKLLLKIEDQLTEVADNLIQQERWQELLDLANKIPLNLNIQEEVNLWSQLSKGAIAASSGTLDGLKTALIQVQDIPENSPLYDKAKSLISIWQQEKDDLTHISKAEELASVGTVASLVSAIAEAELVTRQHPRYQQAQTSIREWKQEIQIIEDQPLLDRAKQLGVSNEPQVLQQAIAQASLIAEGRALYPQAQKYIGQWRSTIQRQQDQPILDQADSLANTDNLSAAIQAAQQIQSGRVLYQEAQKKINSWEQEIKSRQMLVTAENIANQGGVEALIRAIRLANDIPSQTLVKSQAIALINTWSYDLLGWADSQSNSSLTKAIAIANNIPRSSAGYDEARQKIQEWKKEQQESQGRNTLKEAANIASMGTPEALLRAIRVARQVPSGTEVMKDGLSAINNWSEQLLRIAELQSNYSLSEAIAIAKQVPSGTSAYQSAQTNLTNWQQLLQPVTTDSPVMSTGN
jgi:hypothetical protein